MTPHPAAIRWFKRFRPPVLLSLSAAALIVARIYGARYDVLDERQIDLVVMTARICAVGAVGWGVTTFVDALIKRRLRKLNLGERDNLAARKSATRLDVMRRIWVISGATITLALALTVVPEWRQVGVSIFASAGIVALAVGLAARPMLANLIAGLQIAFTQPIRIEDAVVVENEWGWIEEIGLFYVVIRLWDWRRLVVPLSYFIEKPFQNWTRQSASILGSVFWTVDHRAPVQAMREKLDEICSRTELWDGKVTNLQVTESDERGLVIRALASSQTSPEAWDLRCFIREEMIAWLQAEHPYALPRGRADVAGGAGDQPDWRVPPAAAG